MTQGCAPHKRKDDRQTQLLPHCKISRRCGREISYQQKKLEWRGEKTSKALNVTGQEICLSPPLKTGAETPGKKKRKVYNMPALMQKENTNLSPFTATTEDVRGRK